MKNYTLAGEWQLSRDGENPIAGHLPGCTYLDYIANGMENPFHGENEREAKEIGRHEYCYQRNFNLSEEMLGYPYLDLTADGIDTVCTIVVNGKEAGRTNNINRRWRINVKELCHVGENSIELRFANPYEVIRSLQEEDPLPEPMTPMAGVGHLRKTPCHFGWDWGPELAPAGVVRSIGLEAYEQRIEEFRIEQIHKKGSVSLHIEARLSGHTTEKTDAELILTAPDGTKKSYAAKEQDVFLCLELVIENPQLWWCNGLGEQPLYQLDLIVRRDEEELDRLHRQIGLRTISLDTSADAMGNQFRFFINGVPIFARGANWIPADSFVTRADRETIDFYVEAAKHANMNMLRVWGGGMFENEDFYDACDRLGILVWQDFLFACNAYPFWREDFLENVHAEVIDNVKRLRHRASLALWCGNNECEVFAWLWDKKSRAIENNPVFYHKTLRAWVDELDGITPYWPGSPSSGSLEEGLRNMKPGNIHGDTHLWHIWHGMRAIEAFRGFQTRFCSEYGMESMPVMQTIRRFADKESPELFDPVIELHQKCGNGNAKMLYYLLAKYRNPAKFEDFVYLSQLVQANTVRFATDCWRRNIGWQNGALFWQLNDCWPVASWAGIDYNRQLKAVMYQAREFNKMLCISNDYYDDRAELYVVNEYPKEFHGTLAWELMDFSGTLIRRGTQKVSVGATAAKKGMVLSYKEILGGRKKEEAVLSVTLVEDGQEYDKKNWLLVPDKYAALPKVSVEHFSRIENGVASVTLTSTAFVRYVYLEAEGVTAPWSDNFFDILPGEEFLVQVAVPDGMDAKTFDRQLKIKHLAKVEPKNSMLKDKWLRFAMMMGNGNFKSWLIYKVLL